MQILEIILFPIIAVMDLVLTGAHAVTGSHGVAIIVLSFLVYIALIPLRRIATRIQRDEMELQARMAEPIRDAKARYKGEAQFNEIERIYKAHDYHPIKSVRTALGLAIQIPVFLAALLLLVDHPQMQGQPFVFIPDLGQPDQLIPLPFGAGFPVQAVNLLPLAMIALSIAESTVAPGLSFRMRVQANIVGVVILVLIYPLAASMVLYWTCNNVWSLAAALIRRARGARQDTPA
ncbi:hypothetical protein FKB34_06325 [Glycocaulis profundi]|nr:hypothetical protein FKB34_06325 [Glycocaulis profundi]